METVLTHKIVGATRHLASRFGYDSFPAKPDYHYVPDYYGKTAHKHVDIRTIPVFGQIAKDVIDQGNTLLYYDRLYTIYQALANMGRRNDNHSERMHVAEIGVYRGGGSYFIASSLRSLGLNDALVHCFDTFQGHVPEDIQAADTFQKPGMFDDTQYENVKRYLKPFSSVMLYKGRFQDNCAQISDEKFAFVHLDVDLYEVTRFCLDFFDKRLVPGSVVIVDDYGFRTCPGVKQAVDEFMETERDYVGFHLLTGQFIIMKST